MTAIDWNSYGRVRINVVSWPPTESIDRERVQTRWAIETLNDIPDAAHVDLTGLSRDMSFQVQITGPRTMNMLCICAKSMPDPYKIGAASLAWRFLDENLVRLWLIGSMPRAHYPEFMRQRRQLIDRLTPVKRRLWLWLAMIRCEPLLATLASSTIRPEELLVALQDDDFEAPNLAAFLQLYSRIQVTVEREDQRVADDLVGEIGILLKQAVDAAVGGTAQGSTELVASATERLFDALLLVDRLCEPVGADSFAATEDVAWFEDCRLLGESQAGGIMEAVERCRRVSSRLYEFSSQKLTRRL